MLGKLFKYDFKYIAKYAIPAIIVSLISCIMSIGIFRVMVNVDFDKLRGVGNIASVSGVILLIFFIILIAVLPLIMLIISVKRYYDNCFTDEGYLTFTLPAEPGTIVLSKLFAGAIWSIIGAVVTIVSIAAVVLFGPVQKGLCEPKVIEILKIFFKESMSAPLSWLVVVETILLAVISSFFSLSLIYMCVSIGSIIAKKHKILAAIGLYYVISMGLSLIIEIIMMIIGMSDFDMFENYTQVYYNANAEMGISCVILAIFMLIYIGIGVAVHFINQNILKKKLNLS